MPVARCLSVTQIARPAFQDVTDLFYETTHRPGRAATPVHGYIESLRGASHGLLIHEPRIDALLAFINLLWVL